MRFINRIIEESQINLNNLNIETNNLKEQKFSIDNRLNDLVKTSQIKQSELESELGKLVSQTTGLTFNLLNLRKLIFFAKLKENQKKELNDQINNLSETNGQLNKTILDRET